MRPRWRPLLRRGFAGVRARYPEPRRGAELHKPPIPLRGRGSERGNEGRRLYPHPVEWRIGSPSIEAAWLMRFHPKGTMASLRNLKQAPRAHPSPRRSTRLARPVTNATWALPSSSTGTEIQRRRFSERVTPAPFHTVKRPSFIISPSPPLGHSITGLLPAKEHR